MIDISSAEVKNLIIHHVGNKLRDEGFTFSKKEAFRTPTLDALILKNYLAPIVRQGISYQFHHESDISLNTIYHFSKLIFSNPKSLIKNSEAIAKHLYASSNHPNIGGGELMIILFDDIRTESGTEQGLGFFRIEGKSDYLDVADNGGSFQVQERLGISLDKIQKGAVILSGGTKVFAIDSLGQKTKYWLESFLKVIPAETTKVRAQATGTLIKAISKKVESADEALKFGQQIQESLSNSDFLSINAIKNISKSYLDEDEVNSILSGVQSKSGLDFRDELEVDCRQLTKYAKDVITKAKIAEGVNIVISNNEARVSSLDVKKTKHGIRATIEVQIKGE